MEQPTPSSPPSCQFKQYNHKYKQYINCKFPICQNKNNLPFCGNHLPLGEIGPNGKMIQCNYCNQNIGEKIFQKHLLKCTKAIVHLQKTSSQPQDNSQSNNTTTATPRKWLKKQTKLSDIPKETITLLKQKIISLHKKLNLNLSYRDYKTNKNSQDILSKFTESELTSKNSKNLLQEISIYSNLIKEHYLIPFTDSSHYNGIYNPIFIELGCGTAELSKTIQIGCYYNSSHVLIDRMKYRSNKKYDPVIKSNLKKYNTLIREVIDIKDIHLDNYITQIKTNSGKGNSTYDPVIIISKHLCGSACELSFAKVVEYKGKASLSIATCCHYLLTKDDYCNVDLFTQNGFTEDEFNLIARITAWSTLKETNSDIYEMGVKAKELIDYGRCLYLIDKGFINVKLIKYTNETKENHLILGIKPH